MRASGRVAGSWNENQEAAPWAASFVFGTHRALLTLKTAVIAIKTLHNRYTRPEIVMLSSRMPGIGASAD
jgi:hypothetical protein